MTGIYMGHLGLRKPLKMGKGKAGKAGKVSDKD